MYIDQREVIITSRHKKYFVDHAISVDVIDNFLFPLLANTRTFLSSLLPEVVLISVSFRARSGFRPRSPKNVVMTELCVKDRYLN